MTDWLFISIDGVPGAQDARDGVPKDEREAAREALRRRPPEQTERTKATLEAYPSFGEGWHAIRQHLGITSFGVNANEANPGEPLIIPHDEVEHGHEELYVVIRGRVRFEAAGEAMEGGPGDMLYAPPGVLRAATALEDGTLMLLLGGIPGAYEPPIWSRDWRPPDGWRKRSQ